MHGANGTLLWLSMLFIGNLICKKWMMLLHLNVTSELIAFPFENSHTFRCVQHNMQYGRKWSLDLTKYNTHVTWIQWRNNFWINHGNNINNKILCTYLFYSLWKMNRKKWKKKLFSHTIVWVAKKWQAARLWKKSSKICG
jgi:hypothetical protein